MFAIWLSGCNILFMLEKILGVFESWPLIHVDTHFVICNSPQAGFDKHYMVGVNNEYIVGGFIKLEVSRTLLVQFYMMWWCENGGHMMAFDQRNIRIQNWGHPRIDAGASDEVFPGWMVLHPGFSLVGPTWNFCGSGKSRTFLPKIMALVGDHPPNLWVYVYHPTFTEPIGDIWHELPVVYPIGLLKFTILHGNIYLKYS